MRRLARALHRRSHREGSRSDGDTHERLLDAAKALFAEHGFDDVTVRDICREANASLALVNYHFGDKQGLYDVVVDEAIRLIRTFNQETMQAPEGSSAEQKLEHFVRIFLSRVIRQGGSEAWVHKLMQHEVARPTGAASRIGRQAIAPRIRYLSGIVGELLSLPADDRRVMQCVGSVHGLCLIYARIGQMSEPFRRAIMPQPWNDVLDVEAAADHVIAFSLAGIKAVRSKQ